MPVPRSRFLSSINVESLTGSKRTKNTYEHAVREFAGWNASLKNGSKKTFMEEIDKAHMGRFCEYLVDDELENHPYTAALKLLRVNAFIRIMLKLDPGKGPIKKSDYRRELKSGQSRPEIYTPRLSDLALWLPEFSVRIKKIQRRLWDLLPIIRNHVYHPAFNGSHSLKSVLPALVPGMTYEGMEVAELPVGVAASRSG